jgi:hypothetical protein
MTQPAQIDVQALWKWVVAQIKARTHSPGLWRSLEAATPIVVDDDRVVIGYGSGVSHLKSLLLDTRTRNTIEQLFEAGTKRRLRLYIIEGETREDWEAQKAHAIEAERLQQQTRTELIEKAQRSETWEEVGEQLVRRLSTVPNRALPTAQARYLMDAIEQLAEAHQRLMPDSPTELQERGFSRAIERLAERIGTPATVIAYLVYQRLAHPPHE